MWSRHLHQVASSFALFAFFFVGCAGATEGPHRTYTGEGSDESESVTADKADNSNLASASSVDVPTAECRVIPADSGTAQVQCRAEESSVDWFSYRAVVVEAEQGQTWFPYSQWKSIGDGTERSEQKAVARQWTTVSTVDRANFDAFYVVLGLTVEGTRDEVHVHGLTNEIAAPWIIAPYFEFAESGNLKSNPGGFAQDDAPLFVNREGDFPEDPEVDRFYPESLHFKFDEPDLRFWPVHVVTPQSSDGASWKRFSTQQIGLATDHILFPQGDPSLQGDPPYVDLTRNGTAEYELRTGDDVVTKNYLLMGDLEEASRGGGGSEQFVGFALDERGNAVADLYEDSVDDPGKFSLSFSGFYVVDGRDLRPAKTEEVPDGE